MQNEHRNQFVRDASGIKKWTLRIVVILHLYHDSFILLNKNDLHMCKQNIFLKRCEKICAKYASKHCGTYYPKILNNCALQNIVDFRKENI